MKTAIVPSSQLRRYGRWDAGFHIAIKGVAARAKEIEAKHTADELVTMLKGLSTADLAPLAPLLHGQQTVQQRAALLTAAKEYPFFAFALVQVHIDEAIARAQLEKDEKDQQLAKLTAFKSI